MKKRILAFLLAILMVPGLAQKPLAEENGDREGVIYTGTQQKVKDSETDVDADIRDEVEAEILSDWETVEISTPEDLLKLADNCRLDIWSRNKHVFLKNDIDLSGVSFDGIPTFGGTFDGGSHTIREMNISGEESYAGFFVHLQPDAIVEDLNISGRVTPGGNRVGIGGIVGDNYGVLSNCTFEGFVEGKDYIGGIAGYNELSGIISGCGVTGYVSGYHFTGGIAGENMGNITDCTNRSFVNTADKDTALSLKDFDPESYASTILSFRDNEKSEEAAMTNGIVDTGGVAGLNIGIIQHCVNEGETGYEHVGYNVGGIAGRQSGYIYDCVNRATILGRKDVGGIVGQAEPYVTVDLSRDIAYQLSENISQLHDAITVTLKDAGNESDTISDRLSVIQQFTGNALNDTRFLADNTVTFVNGVTGSATEAFSRIDYILEESGKKDGVLDQVSYSAGNAKNAADKLGKTVNDLNLYDYLSDSEKSDYDGYRDQIRTATEEYEGYLADASRAYENYYMWKYADTASYPGTGDLAYKKEDGSGYTYNKNDLNMPDTAAFTYAGGDPPTLPGDMDLFKEKGQWVHHDNTSGEDTDFPSGEDDRALSEQALSDASTAAEDNAETYANSKYDLAHAPNTYSGDMTEAAEGLAELMEKHLPEMSEEVRKDASSAVNSLRDAAGNLESAGSQTRDIVRTVADKPAITFPELSPEYRAHTADLSNNMQAMNDNFGYLNSEMNEASGRLLDDLQEVTDRFDTIMQLYTDAIDGVLEKDYTDSIEDESLSVAETCTDATVDSCRNEGPVEGNINVSGIAGTMGIEYNFDLESDVTGMKDAKLNSTFLTKCVLRNDRNKAPVKAEKSYAGGICGRQEMGTILRCGGYDDVSSASGDYVGGVAGSSLSYIVNSYAKCTLKGRDYVGGIVGDGMHIRDCLTMVKIDDYASWCGAIAGHVSEDGVVRDNRFVGDSLAGIDRVSYSKKAEPISYPELKDLTGEELPEEFGQMKVTFLLKDEDQDPELRELQTISVGYGEHPDQKDYPEVPEKEGFYVVWDAGDGDAVLTDEKITAHYVRNVTTLASGTLLENGQSRILVDGAFREGDSLEANMDLSDVNLADGILETWDIVIPDDGHPTHRLRYMTDDTNGQIVRRWEDSVEVYCDGGEGYRKVESAGKMGQYLLYDVPGGHLRLQIRVRNLNRKTYLILSLVILGILIAAGITLGILVIFYRKRKKIARVAQKIGEKTITAAQNLGSGNRTFYHGQEDEHGDPVEQEDEAEPSEQKEE